MYTYNRYEIWFAELSTLGDSHVMRGKRPVVLVSNDTANEHSPVVTVVPLTSRLYKHHLPTHVFMTESGLSVSSLALCEQVMSVDKNQLIKKIGYVSDRYVRMQLMNALRIQLGMEPTFRPAA